MDSPTACEVLREELGLQKREIMVVVGSMHNAMVSILGQSHKVILLAGERSWLAWPLHDVICLEAWHELRPADCYSSACTESI